MKNKISARHGRLVRHRRSHGGAAREGRLQGLRHQQTRRPSGPAIVRDAAPRRDQRRIGRSRRQRSDAAGGPHRPAREQRRLRCRPRRSGRELDRTGPVDLRDELLRDRPDDTRRRAAHATPGERSHHQHRLRARFPADAVRRALCRDQARDRRLFGIARPRAAHEGHPGLGHRARVHEDAVRREPAGTRLEAR